MIPVLRPGLTAVALAATVGCAAGATDDAAPVPVLARHDVVVREDGIVPLRFEGVAGDPVSFHNATSTSLRITAADGSFRSPPLEPGRTWVLRDPPLGDRVFSTTARRVGQAVLSVGPPDAPAALGWSEAATR